MILQVLVDLFAMISSYSVSQVIRVPDSLDRSDLHCNLDHTVALEGK